MPLELIRQQLDQHVQALPPYQPSCPLPLIDPDSKWYIIVYLFHLTRAICLRTSVAHMIACVNTSVTNVYVYVLMMYVGIHIGVC